jgi:hypothetical protein
MATLTEDATDVWHRIGENIMAGVTALGRHLDQRLDAVDAGQVELKERVGVLEAGQAELKAGQGELRAGLAEANSGIARLTASGRCLHRGARGPEALGTAREAQGMVPGSRERWLRCWRRISC